MLHSKVMASFVYHESHRSDIDPKLVHLIVQVYIYVQKPNGILNATTNTS